MVKEDFYLKGGDNVDVGFGFNLVDCSGLMFKVNSGNIGMQFEFFGKLIEYGSSDCVEYEMYQ